MKQLLEYLINNHINNRRITIDSFKKDVENIIKEAGLKLEPDSWNARADNPGCSTETIQGDYMADYNYTKNKIYLYHFYCDYETPENKGHYNVQQDKFILSLGIWFDEDEDFNRPRYKFDNFALVLPGSRGNGYDIHNTDYEFVSKKVTSEHYDAALENITGVIKSFVDNKDVMQKVFSKSNIRALDLENTMKKIFLPYIR